MEKQESARRVAKLGLKAVRRAGSAALPVVKRLAEPLQRKLGQNSGNGAHPAGPMPTPTSGTTPGDSAPAARPAPSAKAAPAPMPPAAPVASDATAAPAEPAAAPPAAEPDHVDREATLVRESVDPDAADHVGAQIHIEEPWDGYSDMRAVDIVERLADASPEMLAVVRLYEQANRDRVTVLDAIDRRLAAQSG
jgi:hypothetical protein